MTKILYFVLVLYITIFNIVLCDSTCDPDDFDIDRNYKVYWPPSESYFKLYNCELSNGDKVVACKVDVPWDADGFIAFKLEKSKSGKCDEICRKATKDDTTLVANLAGRVVQEAKVGNQFIQRYTYNNKVCDVHFKILASKYQDNTFFRPGNFYNFLKEAVDWAAAIIGLGG